MSNYNLMPADTYQVINKTIITNKDIEIITNLYQPIIGSISTSLFFTLLDDLNNKEIMSLDLTHYHLMTSMQVSLEVIEEAREKLEALGLLKSYIKNGNVDNYIYEIYSPITPLEFFNHPILNIVLYNNLGKQEYDKLKNLYKYPKINLKEYKDITKNINEVFKVSLKTDMEIDDGIRGVNTRKIISNNGIDFTLLQESIPKNMISNKCFNEENKNLINSLAFIYNLNTIDMQELIKESLNEKGMIDKTELRKSARNYYQFNNRGNLPTLIYNKQPEFLKKPKGDSSKWAQMVYLYENITPYQLLKKTYNGAEPTDRDKKLVESLLVDQKLNYGVVNVLIAYVLKVNNKNLNKNFIETIAGQWKRLNIQTVEEAMKVSEKDHNKYKKLSHQKNKTETKKIITKTENDNIPIWFEKNLQKQEASKDESKEMEDLLNNLI